MITIKNRASIQKMEQAGAKLSAIMSEISSVVVEGNSTMFVNNWIEQRLKENDLVSRMKGYMGYGYVSCISVNNQVVHGVPSEHCILQKNDFLTIDVCASFKGYCADMARMFFVGDMPDHVREFARVAQDSLCAGIGQACIGNRLGDISFAIQKVIEGAGYGIVTEFAGHGIGRRMHEDPEILNYGSPGTGPVLQEGMAFALEPMITMGKGDVYVAADGWTVYTSDNTLAAHVEDTIVITKDGPKNITRIMSHG